VKIDNSRNVPPPEPAPLQRSPAHAESSTAAASDEVQLSRLPSAATVDASRSSRIAELRLQVEQGSYRVPAEDVARGIVDEMLGNPKP
jgi:anti-sigma28 factor (negative regulator of flagellin synthesis)